MKMTSYSDQLNSAFTQDELVVRLTTLFGVLALLLASIGLYGVTAYAVARRTSEIGIRMALGASRSSVLAMIVKNALTQAGIGLLLGLPLAYAGGRLVKHTLYQTEAYQPMVLVSVSLDPAACSHRGSDHSCASGCRHRPDARTASGLGDEQTMHTLWLDVRYAFRQLRRSPAFTVTAILTLGLGLGATATMYNVIHDVLTGAAAVCGSATACWGCVHLSNGQAQCRGERCEPPIFCASTRAASMLWASRRTATLA